MINIQIDQVGYRPNDYKTATFRIEDTNSVSDSVKLNGNSGNTFRVIDVINNEVVFESELSKEIKSEPNGEVNRVGDFSSLNKVGKYVIETEKYGKSYEFEIKDNIYEDVLKSTLKMFYLQRCGCALEEKYAGVFAHKECHNTMARIYGTDKYIDVSGGWHDAGDYGRYTVAASKSVVDLMMAYECFPDVLEKPFDIPDDGSNVPDILREVKYELDFMLKMQDSDTGGVYHKVTCSSFPGFVMPEYEKDELIVSPVSDAATCDFAAAMAHAYRVYKDLSKKYGDGAKEYEKAADTYLEAANKAIEFLLTNHAGEFVNPAGIVTGEYGDTDTRDEYFFAYAEMFNTTGDKKYEELLKGMDLAGISGDFGWKEVGDYGFYAYLSAPHNKDKEFNDRVSAKFINEASEKQFKYLKDPYKSTIYGHYYWGCNMEVANNAMRGILIDRLKGTNSYRMMAHSQLHYLLGNNPNSKCFVTGFGTDTVMHPHHRPSAAVNSPMPGMLVGGAEPLLLDDVAKRLLNNKAPAKCYIDELDSYSTNEITIYWNSPLVFLLAYMNE